MHWGTFSLAMHAWDQPVERLLQQAPKLGVQLVMPQLGQPVEPVQVESVTPWWRSVDGAGGAAAAPQPISWPKSAAWPMD